MFFILYAAAVLGIVVAELVLWRLFRRKISEMYFPHELDTSYFRFFTMLRLRALAIMHAVVLIVAVSFAFFLQW